MALRPFNILIQSCLVISSSLIFLSCSIKEEPNPDPVALELDTDQDGVIDRLDDDDDNDGVVDRFDAFPLDAAEYIDTDNDNIGDNSDTDIDNDTYNNLIDKFPLDSTEWSDLDNDGIGDNSDSDIDGDSHNNLTDIFPMDATEWLDFDNDGIGDNSDLDIDGDTHNNDVDSFPTDSTEWSDFDNDGLGDNSDPDIDGDSHNNLIDIFPMDATEWLDFDNDGMGDNSDLDIDDDTYNNDIDSFPMDATEWSDFDNDGLGDNSDPDIDNDNILNENDADSFDINIGLDTDKDGIADLTDSDIDGDGVDNYLDDAPYNPLISADADNDGIDDSVDNLIDSDFDLIADSDDAFPNDADRSSCDQPNDLPIYGQQQMRVLLSYEYSNTIKDLFDVTINSEELPYDYHIFSSIKTGNNKVINSDHLNIYTSLANSITDEFSLSLYTQNCVSNQTCETTFINDLLPKIFRRELTLIEKSSYSYFFNNSQFDTQDNEIAGFKLALNTALTSPYFLHRFEIGLPIINQENKFELTAYEMASFLSYTYTGSTPDTELLLAAKHNTLQTDAQVLIQIERLLHTAKAKIQMGEFAAQWMNSERVLDEYKDPELFPNFTYAVKQAMSQQTKEIFKDAFLDSDLQFSDLYSPNHGYISARLSDFYSNKPVGDENAFYDEFFITTQSSEFGGFTTAGSFLSTTSSHTESSIIKRAVFVRERMLCQSFPPFPTSVDLDAIRNSQAQLVEEIKLQEGDNITQAHLDIILLNTQGCIGCHKTMTIPLGLGLEDYDAVGRLRSSYNNGIPVTYTGPDESREEQHSALYGINYIYDRNDPIKFEGAKQLGDILATSATAKACYAEMAFRFTMGQGTVKIDASNEKHSKEEMLHNSCAKKSMTTNMSENNDSLKAAFIQLGLSDLVRYRTLYTREQ
ncbi:MAG: DUF1592 domain-containing protein [Saccharospirillaceae bacterium]|nr:DUF1592 domain-containing protein [Pseudomonadales bacterium]NRB80722.1 DUF1592 domain-containing protein [Saccharospirillaceae bacterium]